MANDNHPIDFSGLMDKQPSFGKASTGRSAVPQSLYKLFGADITPEMEQQAPYPTAIARTAQEGIATPSLHFLNMAAGGIPEVLARKYGYTMPQPKTLPGKALTTAADIAGFVKGAPMRVGRGAASIIPRAARGTRIGAKAGLGALREATQFGIGSALHTPPDDTLKKRGIRGIIGSGVGAVSGTIGGLTEHFTGLLSDKALLRTGKEIRGGFKGFTNKLTNWYGGKIKRYQTANPSQRVDISKELDDFKVGLEDKAKFKTLQSASPRLRKALSSKGRNLTLEESQNLVNQLESTVSEGQLSGFKVRPSGGEVNVFINSIKDSMQRSFPGIKHTRGVYGTMKNFTKSVENYMRYGKTVQGLKTMVKNPELNKALKTILPEDTYNTVAQTAAAQTLTKEGMKTLNYVIRYGIMYQFMRKLLPQMGGNEGPENLGE